MFCAASAAIAQGAGPHNLHGEWRGQTQYQATIGGKADDSAHTVTNLTIRVEPDGKVWGTSTENGCKLLGVWSPMGATMNVANLDVTLKGCQYSGFNQRYAGNLAFYSAGNVQLSLHKVASSLGKVSPFDIKATMRR